MLSLATSSYINLMGTVFLIIFGRVILFPQQTLKDVGVDFTSQTITGRAELRAWYAGTALTLAALIFDGRVLVDTKLKAIGYCLSGFIIGRLVNYNSLGRDPNEISGEIVISLEIVGLVASTILRYLNNAQVTMKVNEKSH
mmetsp:Transcript_17085/g.35179  ORF Transcript_17085/g.35179 Transcript_17085/m.35179 type:complete len:141 (+) Transcript_17085:49-471(+)